MIKFYKILFLNSLILGTLITITSFSWFSMWLGLEINLLSIIPLLSSYKNLYPAESAIKYFITQALASTIMIFSIMSMLKNYEIINNSYNLFTLMFNSSILLKMGSAPFHFWLPEIMEGLNWSNNLIILTWQKLAPMILCFYFMKMNNFYITAIISSSMISGIMGLNQQSIRKIMAFSSINHISWMLSSMFISSYIWLFYFLIYSIISISLINFFKKNNIFFIFQLFNVKNYWKIPNLMFSMIFLSLGGLPPFLGFFPKWLIIFLMIKKNLIFIAFILMIMTLISLFYYLRLMLPFLMNFHQEFLNTKIYKISFISWMMIFINLFGIIFTPSLLWF
uniref:NADH-ubiquinone oxidoreductase chain 2 n=1 Tax=Propalticus sp. PRO01 TaxID=1205574 RepID=A0A0S2MQA8_9CUCU|nr:NADH deshydrogenase subunit 2 [Propalticus sp. PRO01]